MPGLTPRDSSAALALVTAATEQQYEIVGFHGFSIADPADQGMLDVAGFDTATPQLISEFARGAL